MHRVTGISSSDLGHKFIRNRDGRFLWYCKRCVCMQMADGEELAGRAQPRQLLEDLPLTKSSAYPMQLCVSEEIAFISMFN